MTTPKRRSTSNSGRAPVHRAERAEAGARSLSFSYDGDTYTLADPEAWDLDVLEAVESDKMVRACQLLLGPTQWAHFRRKRRTMRELISLFNAAWSASGVRVGE